MSTLSWPDHLLTIDEWDDLSEDTSRRFELVDGMLQMSPKPTVMHQRSVRVLLAQLQDVGDGNNLEAVPDVDVVLVEAPPLVRAPDLVVIERSALGKSRLHASDVLLAIEIVSPGSARVDRVSKLAEYAEAGIADYWIVDVADGVTVDVFALAGDAYELADHATGGLVTMRTPVPMTLDLDALLR